MDLLTDFRLGAFSIPAPTTHFTGWKLFTFCSSCLAIRNVQDGRPMHSIHLIARIIILGASLPQATAHVGDHRLFINGSSYTLHFASCFFQFSGIMKQWQSQLPRLKIVRG